MVELDWVDKEILTVLRQDARMSMAEIGRRVHMSRVAVRQRINRLIEEGVIEDFTTVVNAKALGYDVHAFFEVEVVPNQLAPKNAMIMVLIGIEALSRCRVTAL
jgi:Lrp/AsnC family leucine-responsive transcriptional regulator